MCADPSRALAPQACKRIQLYLQVAGGSAGADDVFPILVFCIIKAQLVLAPSNVEVSGSWRCH